MDMSTRKASLFSTPTRELVHRASAATIIRSSSLLSYCFAVLLLLLPTTSLFTILVGLPIVAVTVIGLKNALLRTSSPASICITVANASYGLSMNGNVGAVPGIYPHRTRRDISMTDNSPPCIDLPSMLVGGGGGTTVVVEVGGSVEVS